MNTVLVIFEVTIKQDYMDEYLNHAQALKAHVAKTQGFMRAERFSSLVAERKLLSLSVWENEEAVAEWRNHFEHRERQQKGRDSIFESYTITVAKPLRKYTDSDRTQAPEDSNVRFNQ